MVADLPVLHFVGRRLHMGAVAICPQVCAYRLSVDIARIKRYPRAVGTEHVAQECWGWGCAISVVGQDKQDFQDMYSYVVQVNTSCKSC